MRGRLVLAGEMEAGLALTHYVVTLFYALFVLAWLALSVGWRGRDEGGGLAGRAAVPRLAVVALLALGLALPWAPRFAGSRIAPAAAALSTNKLSNPDLWGVVRPADVWGTVAPLALAPLDRHVGLGLAAATAFALGWGLARRQRVVALGALWIALLLVGAYPGVVGWDVTGVLKDFTVAIGLYVPAGLVVGGALADLVDGAARRSARALPLAVVATITVAAALAWKDRAPVDPVHVLVTPADERAMAWIRHHTAPEAVFLAGSFHAFGGSVPAGDDAGWWIPLLAERQNTLPPITAGLELGFDPALLDRLNELTAATSEGLDEPATRALLDEAGVTHVYLGKTGQSLDRAALAASADWERVYDEEGVQIYARARQAAR
jgi:hypothetical protein